MQPISQESLFFIEYYYKDMEKQYELFFYPHNFLVARNLLLMAFKSYKGFLLFPFGVLYNFMVFKYLQLFVILLHFMVLDNFI